MWTTFPFFSTFAASSFAFRVSGGASCLRMSAGAVILESASKASVITLAQLLRVRLASPNRCFVSTTSGEFEAVEMMSGRVRPVDH
jgi:hypothetical protein